MSGRKNEQRSRQGRGDAIPLRVSRRCALAEQQSAERNRRKEEAVVAVRRKAETAANELIAAHPTTGAPIGLTTRATGDLALTTGRAA